MRSELYTVTIIRQEQCSLGIAISGGTDTPYLNDTSIRVTDILVDGPAYGKLQINDCIVSVNGVILEGVTHSFALQEIQRAGQVVDLVIQRLESVLNNGLTNKAYHHNGEIARRTFQKRSVGMAADPIEDYIMTQMNNKESVSNHFENNVKTRKNAIYHHAKELVEMNQRVGEFLQVDENSKLNIMTNDCHQNHQHQDSSLKQSGSHELILQRSVSGTRDLGFLYEKRLVVTKVASGSVAHKKGLFPGDIILAIDGLSTALISNEYAYSILSNQSRDAVQLTVQSQNCVQQQQQQQYRVLQEIVEGDDERDNAQVQDEPVSIRRIVFHRGEAPAAANNAGVKGGNSNGVGLRIRGGNISGVYVAGVQPDSLAEKHNIRVGDRLLAVNGESLTHYTKEEVVLALVALKDVVDISIMPAQEAYADFVKTNESGDRFYVQCHFDYTSKLATPNEMPLRRGDVLLIKDTLWQGVVGSWQALRVHPISEKQLGIIPNQSRAEQLALSIRNSSLRHQNLHSANFVLQPWYRRNGGVILADTKMDAMPTSKIISFVEPPILPAYIRVVQRFPQFVRPVVVYGALAGLARKELISQQPDRYQLPHVDAKHGIKISTIKRIIEHGRHAVLEITPEAVLRLSHAQLAPIVVFIKCDRRTTAKEQLLSLNKDVNEEKVKSWKHLWPAAVALEQAWGTYIFTAVLHVHQFDEWFDRLFELIHQQQNESVWMSESQLDKTMEEDDYLQMMLSDATARRRISRSTNDLIGDEKSLATKLTSHSSETSPPVNVETIRPNYSSKPSAIQQIRSEEVLVHEQKYLPTSSPPIVPIIASRNAVEDTVVPVTQAELHGIRQRFSQLAPTQAPLVNGGSKQFTVPYDARAPLSNGTLELNSKSAADSKTATFMQQKVSTNLRHEPIGAPSNFLAECSTSSKIEKNVAFDGMILAEEYGAFDFDGGVLKSNKTGVSLHIPRGALPINCLQQIYFKVFDESKVLSMNGSRGSRQISPLTLFGPPGLRFRKPVEIRLPYTANSANSLEDWNFRFFTSSLSDSGRPEHWREFQLNPGRDNVTKITDNSISIFVDQFG